VYIVDKFPDTGPNRFLRPSILHACLNLEPLKGFKKTTGSRMPVSEKGNDLTKSGKAGRSVRLKAFGFLMGCLRFFIPLFPIFAA
jgi:hypothetical protein